MKSGEPRRGEVWWANLPSAESGEAGWARPVLIVQANFLTESTISSVLVVSITSNLRLEAMPGNVRLSIRDSGLPSASVVNVSQVVAANRGRLTKKVKRVPDDVLNRVNDGLKKVLALP